MKLNEFLSLVSDDLFDKLSKRVKSLKSMDPSKYYSINEYKDLSDNKKLRLSLADFNLLKKDFIKPTVGKVKCDQCNKFYYIIIDNDDVDRWKSGELVQRAFSYLTEGERELLMTGICNTCFNEMFKDYE